MRVMYIIHATVMGGATIALKDLVDELEKYNVDPVWIIPKNDKGPQDGILLQFINQKGWKYQECYVNPLGFPIKEYNILKKIYREIRYQVWHKLSMRDLRHAVEKYNPDIIHTNTGIIQEGYFLSKKLGIPHVWHVREYQDKDFSTKPHPNMAAVSKYFNDTHTICITNAIQKYFAINKNNSKVIYDPLFSENSAGEIDENKDKYFLIANRLSPEKGIEDLLISFNEFIKLYKDYKLIIAGSGREDYKEKLLGMCDELGISNYVNFIGFVKNVKPLMKKAKCLLVGSFCEGFGMMTAEANMLGCPVIGRNSAGTKEILETTGGGILCETKEDFVNAMCKMASLDDQALISMMKNAPLIAIKNYTKELSGKKVYEFYDEILKHKTL